MNKRIKELAEQVGYYIDSDFAIEFELLVDLVGKDILNLTNKNGNIKPDAVNAYFGFEFDRPNKDNIEEFINERTN